LVVSSTKMVTRPPPDSSGQGDGLSGRIEHRRRHVHRLREVRFEDRPSFVGVRAVEADDDRRPHVDPADGLDDAVGDLVAPGDAAEDVDEDGPHRRVVVDDLERPGHDVGVGATTDVEEVGRAAPHLVDDVDRRHGEAGTVGDHPDGPVESDVLEALGVGGGLALIAGLGPVELRIRLVPEHRVGVEGDLGVEDVDPAVVGEDQWVDLDEVGVAVHIRLVEPAEDVDGALHGGLGQAGSRHPVSCRGLVEAVDGVDPDLGDGVGVLVGNRLDLDAT